MRAPARVPQVMMVESFHHRLPSLRFPIRKYETPKVIATEIIDVSHTNDVSGCSKFIVLALP
jgi:hypothetical protein